ncbi:MAG: CHAT domain-containing protein [Crocosphaera sp.]
MNEQRTQAYLNLINQLLSCKEGDEPKVLQENQELLDQELIEVMIAVAQQYEEKGRKNEAQFLISIAQQLAQMLGLLENEKTAIENTYKDYFSFLMETLQKVSKNPNLEAIYPFWAQNLDKLDDNLITILYNWVKNRLSSAKAEEVQNIADVVNFSDLITEFSLGNIAINQDIGIAGYEIALTVFTFDRFPQKMAKVSNNLGVTYSNRIRGDKAENLEKALMAYAEALKVYTFEEFPEDWAMTQYNLGVTYSDRIRGDKAENLEKALMAYTEALKVYTFEKFPEDWAIIHNNLAIIYSYRIRGDKAENLEKAITVCTEALKVRTFESFPYEWAMTQKNLANAYSDRIKGDKAENIERAIKAYTAAIKVYTFEEFPEDWANIQTNLASAYSHRIRGDKAENIERAIKAYTAALKVCTFEKFPEDWARIKNNLANAYSDRIKGNKAENLEKALSTYQQVLKVYTLEKFPYEWAMTQNNLAATYSKRIRGNKAENLEKALSTHQQVLKIYAFETFPCEWAMTQINLANAYFDRIIGHKAENLEKVIAYYHQAFKVYTFDVFPQDWSMTHNNLAAAYRNRIRGDKAENLEKAITSCQEALKVRTFEAFPQQWAETQNNLATAYLYRIRGDKAENLEKAITYFQQALKVRTFDTFPQQWAGTQHNLAAAYSNRIKGDKAENLENAIVYYQQALKVRTFETFPFDWAGTQNNFAITYINRIRGDKAENIEIAITSFEGALKVRTFEAFPLDWAGTHNNLAIAYSDRIRGDKAENIESAILSCQNVLKVFLPQTLPEDCRDTARLLGNLYAQENRWREAIKPYQTALEAVEVLYEDAVTLLGKEDVLSATDDLFHRTAYALAHVGELESAVVTLERGRARNLRETLARDRADLETVKQLNPELYKNYQEIANELRNLEQQERMRMTFEGKNNLGATPESNLQLIQQTRQRLKTVLADIRKLPGYENFLALPTFAEITQAVTTNKPLIYLTTTEYGSLALIVNLNATEVSITPVQVDSLNNTQLRELLFNTEKSWFGAYVRLKQELQSYQDWRNNYEGERDSEEYRQINQQYYDKYQKAQAQWFDTIDTVTHQLWSKLMEPVISHLQQNKFQKAILIPTGLLSLLPLHAAWKEDKQAKSGRKYALDDISFAYIPNALSLIPAREIAHNTPPDSILAIDEPLPVNANKLPNSTLEVQTALETFPNHHIFKHEEANQPDVKKALNNYGVVHFSCHGFADFTEPLKSGLLMSYDQILSLQDLFELNLQIRLAILSACETSLPGMENLDEVVSLPTGLLQTGVAGVVASLWSVSEISTMILVARFYDFWRKDNLETSEALLKAQKWIRDTTKQEKADHFKTISQSSNSQTAKKIYQKILLQVSSSDDFAHPFHWAAFGYHGI